MNMIVINSLFKSAMQDNVLVTPFSEKRWIYIYNY